MINSTGHWVEAVNCSQQLKPQNGSVTDWRTEKGKNKVVFYDCQFRSLFDFFLFYCSEICRRQNSKYFVFFIFFLGSGPEGADDLCFHTGEISPPSSSPSSSSPPPLLSASRPKSQPQGPILAFNLKSQPRIISSSSEDMEEEKLPHVCESIGHRPLWTHWKLL